MSIMNKAMSYVLPLAMAGAVAMSGLEGKANDIPVQNLSISDIKLSSKVIRGNTNNLWEITATNTLPGTNYTLLVRDSFKDGQNEGHYWSTNQTAQAVSNSLNFKVVYDPAKTQQFFKVQYNTNSPIIPTLQ